MARVREEIAVQKAKESELNKTIHITGYLVKSMKFWISTDVVLELQSLFWFYFFFVPFAEETMRAKQMLATMSHEIRSPLTGVVSMAEILSTTKLDREQRQLLGVMISSGDLVLQLINDILDLSKVESGLKFISALLYFGASYWNRYCKKASHFF